jgi:hypothetical protein
MCFVCACARVRVGVCVCVCEVCRMRACVSLVMCVDEALVELDVCNVIRWCLCACV